MAKNNCIFPTLPEQDMFPEKIKKMYLAKNICECSTYPFVGLPNCPLCKGKGYIGDLIELPVKKTDSLSSGEHEITMNISFKKP